MKLRLSTAIQSKIKYFNSRFPSKEWSGPAWYSVKADEHGFPEEFTLRHFHPIDLGHGTATEWEAKDLAKILKQTYENFPRLKKCFIGLIHSHHTMGAFFSGTDTSTLEDMAPAEGFYASLVVATQKEPYAFAFSYRDQYGQSQCIEVDKEDIIGTPIKAKDDWIEVADSIEKAAKKTTTYVGTAGQTSFLPSYNGYNGVYADDNGLSRSTDYTTKDQKKADEAVQLMKDSKLTWWEFKEAMEEEGLDPMEYWDDRPNQWSGHFGY